MQTLLHSIQTCPLGPGTRPTALPLRVQTGRGNPSAHATTGPVSATGGVLPLYIYWQFDQGTSGTSHNGKLKTNKASESASKFMQMSQKKKSCQLMWHKPWWLIQKCSKLCFSVQIYLVPNRNEQYANYHIRILSDADVTSKLLEK